MKGVNLMIIENMIEEYDLLKKETKNKTDALVKIPEKDLYNAINTLDDDYNEILYKKTISKFLIPEEKSSTIIIPHENLYVTIPEMKKNIEEFDKYFQSSLSFIKNISAKPFSTYLTSLNELSEIINTCIDYKTKKEEFLKIDIIENGKIQLDSPALSISSDGNLIFSKIKNAGTYTITYNKINSETPPIDLTEIKEIDNNINVSLKSISEAGSYIIKVQANPTDQAYLYSISEIEYVVE